MSATGEVIDLTRQLVMRDSTSGTDGEVLALEWVAGWLRERGARVRIENEAGRPAALLATAADASNASPLLLFAGHVDVVPVADHAAWVHPPFAAEVHDGRLFGRGASDMKSGLAASLLAAREAWRHGSPVAIGVTTGEEVGCLGAPALARLLAPHRVGAVVIPESTGNDVVLGHRGATWLTVSSRGLAAHGSTPERGVNAVLRLAAALARLGELPLRSHPRLGPESVNVGTIRGGSATNIVPDRASATIDLRTVDDARELVEWWRQLEGIDEVSTDLSLAAVWTGDEHPFVASLPAAVSGRPASYFTDASVLIDALGPGVPIVVWGPGDPATVHTVDESVPVEAAHEAARLFTLTALGWGGCAGPDRAS
ncbi:M20/M25/M40 family metallo-hydrolase [Herbiconiux moechotypicola]|uniref:M20 family metallopeptidase n=1 Tax=Herbiconiux moechotypicola TaxID=637393 RepID=A0ABN3D9Y8_9MICO|nr:M20/M25/M40 family metallo-hydrolase [Herbiconiux moechotypicola]MCS5729007.1 M20/M25/M40 family metallo-hydrolase [Herbiconiux moechotypicola]